jgi:phage gp36-like protein
MAYCSGAEFLQRYDSRRVAQLVSDDGTVVPFAGLTGNGNILAALEDATAEINAAVLVGKRYTARQLEPNPTDGGPLYLTLNGYYLLKRLCSDLAFGYLVARRGLSAGESGSLAPRFEQAMAMIDRIRYGERIFDLADQSAADAGLAHSQLTGIESQFATNSIVRAASSYYGVLPVIRYNNF